MEGGRVLDIGFGPLDTIDFEKYPDGRLSFMSGVLDRLHIPDIIGKAMTSATGRKPDIPYDILAKLMMLNIADKHMPLYRLNEYYEEKDIKGLTGIDIDPEMLYDTRFGKFLSKFYKAGPQGVFSDIAVYALATYGITITALNFDTTTKIMWGEYKNKNGQTGVISITFGHSKANRKDKKQLKVGAATADGVLAHAEVLSGNKDDKTYNFDNLNESDAWIEQFNISKDNFYYIADCALFTEKNVKKANDKDIKIITRVPESTKKAKELIKKAWEKEEEFHTIAIETTQKEDSEYQYQEFTDTYKGYPCKFTVCYSESLREQKEKSLYRAAKKEKTKLNKLTRQYKKEEFHCQKDAQKVVDDLHKKKLKTKYHDVDCHIISEVKRGVGRPKDNIPESEKTYIYKVKIEASKEPVDMDSKIDEAATFVLGSNDQELLGEDMLTGYKTQNSVETKFSQLKSPHFVNSIFLNKPERIVAFVYLLLIILLSLSVVEKVVRRALGEENETIIGPGKVMMKRPSLRAILDIFMNVTVKDICYNGVHHRYLKKPLNASQKKILRYLGLTENIFIKQDLEGFFARTGF